MAEAFAATVDVRPLPSREKHLRIHRTFSDLPAAGAMLLINDHDPKPLRYEIEAERPEEFDWSDIESGPEVWRVRIGKRSPAG